MNNQWKIRMATEDDTQQILSIYAPYVLESPATFETDPPSFGEMRGRIKKIRSKFPYLVAENEEGIIVSYAYAGSLRARPAYDWSVETTIYSAPQACGSGVAAALYEKLEELLRLQGVTNMYACIASPNPASERFHEKCGYSLVGRFTNCGFKNGEWLGVTWWEKLIASHEENPQAVRRCCEA